MGDDDSTTRAFHYFICDVVCEGFALYVVYLSYLALKAGGVDKMKSCLKMWCCLGVWKFAQIITDLFFWYLSIYPEIKMGFMAFLVLGGGAAKIYDPHLDKGIEKAVELLDKHVLKKVKSATE
mmetsp:Transcript_4829/g.9162  ORF Transcript_4829/g.9162 Transcript_4829/m.9162 type:complete len:123 (+) Transcript_4829:38-406(+)